MEKVTTTSARKTDHIRINLEENVNSGIRTGFENFQLPHRALPEISLRAIDTTTIFLEHSLDLPILISSMTGGTPEAADINRNLAIAAQEKKIAMGVGSQRISIEDSSTNDTFDVREVAPDIFLMANIGAVQLNYGYDWTKCQNLIDNIQANALILHFNPLQEALQPEGDTNFADLAPKIADVVNHVSVPVIAKEVGWGFSKKDIDILIQCGISAIDVAGAGGTSWSQVEMFRSMAEEQKDLAKEFLNWGFSTTEAIHNVKMLKYDFPIISSGGLKTGLDMAKSIALGASLCGYAGAFLKAGTESPEAVIKVINNLEKVLRIGMFSTGCVNIPALKQIELLAV